MASPEEPTVENGGDAGPSTSSSQPPIQQQEQPIAPLTAAELRRRLTTISSSDHLYLRLPSGLIRYVQPRELDPHSTASASGPGSRKHKIAVKALRSNTVAALGKFGTFDLDDLQGVPYGWTWEIGPPKAATKSSKVGDEEGEQMQEALPEPEVRKGKGKHKAASSGQSNLPGSLRVMVGGSLAELEETTATNEDIFDEPAGASSLTMLDIQAMKDAGLQGQDIIEEMLKSSSSYEKRTVYSQDKYVKRKEAKHLKLFTPLAPSLATLADYHFEQRSIDKIRGLRADSLAQMLSFANVGAGGRYIVVDGTSGLVSGACLERMAGQGRVMTIRDTESPPEYDILRAMNLPPSTIDPVLDTLNWAQVAQDYEPPFVPPLAPLLGDDVPKDTPDGIKQHRARERERSRGLKRLQAQAQVEALRQELFDGDWDAVLIACPYEPVSIIKALLPYLPGSAQIVVHSPLLQPLVEAHAQLRGNSKVVNVSITEPWLRKYQVLPGRTHPEMMTSATAGFILHATRVFTEHEAQEYMTKCAREAAVEGDEEGQLEARAGETDSASTAAIKEAAPKRSEPSDPDATEEEPVKKAKLEDAQQ